MPLDQPLFIVRVLELLESCLQFLNGVEGPYPEQVFLQGPDEALGAAVAFRRAKG
jgi:hypothetical protein